MEVTTLKEYQDKSIDYANYPAQCENLAFPIQALAASANAINKKLVDVAIDGHKLNRDLESNHKATFVRMLGETLWWLSAVAYELDIGLNVVANKNMAVMESQRKKRLKKE